MRVHRRLRLTVREPAGRAVRLPWVGRLIVGIERVAERLHRVPQRYASHATGQKGEDLAYWFLREHGYTIVARNYRRSPQPAEIDLIGWDRSTLVFVEVKTRTAEGDFEAERAVDVEKRESIGRLAHSYLRRRGYAGAYRFDLVTIYSSGAKHPSITLHRDAFRGSGGTELIHA